MNSMLRNSNKLETRNNIVDRIRLGFPRKLCTSSSSTSANRVDDCCYTQFLIENHSNFNRSGAPGRFMYYEDGSWVDYSDDVLNSLRSGFLDGKPMVEVQIDGSRWMFDFYRMMQIDCDNGNWKSIAWIDVDGKCFFPKSFRSGNSKMENLNVGIGDSSSENPKIEIEIRISEDWNSSKRKREEEKVEGSSSNDQHEGSKKRKQLDSDLESPRWPKAKLLKEGEKAYSIVKNLFLSGLGIVDPGAVITGIHQCVRTGPVDIARYEVFQKRMEITKSARGGEPNMTFAWHGTSAEGVKSILTHGFGMPSKISGSEAHGIGIHLSPVRSPHSSAILSEVDDNGEKHVILCRVILGRCERVEAGSRQFHPSSVDFDTGVDDVKNPKWYVVWCGNMNTNILPQCVVSYRSSFRVPGQFNGSSFLKWMPNGSSTLTAKFFSKLGNSLPSYKVQDLQTLCGTYKDGKVAKDTFMKRLRSIVGDEMLLWTIREIRG